MSKGTVFPRLYPIIDVGAPPEGTASLIEFAEQLREGGATLIQYRNKIGAAAEMIGHLRELRRVIAIGARLIVNDRADLLLACGCDGVHLGQQDISVDGARRIVGDEAMVGISTHDLHQIFEADKSSADYIAVGPIFKTATKKTPALVVGLEFIQAARKVTRKPLVAIGGITRANCRSVIEAGADSVAVISDLKDSPSQAVEEFLRILA